MGWRQGSSFHEGIDIHGSKGEPVRAAHDGVVLRAGPGMSGYGKMLVIKGKHGLMTVYAHNDRILVKVGDHVERGEEVAEVGSTGKATGPHLHFETRIESADGRWVAVNPAVFFKREGASLTASNRLQDNKKEGS